MVLLDMNVGAIKGLLGEYAREDPSQFTTIAQHAFVLLKSITEQDEDPTPRDLATARNRATAAELQATRLQSELDQLKLTNQALAATVLAAQSTPVSSSPSGPAEKFEKIELYSGNKEELRTFLAKLRMN